MERCQRCDKEHDGSFGSGKYCSRFCANSRIFSEESKKKKSAANKGSTPPNKGKKISWVISTCHECGQDIHHRKSTPKKYHHECWLKSSGGLRKGSGRGKSGWYKGYWCDSSYELVWVIYQLDHNKHFKRNKVEYEYQWNGKIRKYLPDFIQDNTVIEIKGFITEQTKVKSQSVNNLKILSKNDLKTEFDYVQTKYGKNFIELYESNPHKTRKKQCKVCEKPSVQDYCSRRCSAIGNNRNSHSKK